MSEFARKTAVHVDPSLAVDREGGVVGAVEQVQVWFSSAFMSVGRGYGIRGPGINHYRLAVDGFAERHCMSTGAPVWGKSDADSYCGLRVRRVVVVCWAGAGG